MCNLYLNQNNCVDYNTSKSICGMCAYSTPEDFKYNELMMWLHDKSLETLHTSKYHNEDLFLHVLLVVHYVNDYNDKVLNLSAYLHDIGKPSHHGQKENGDNTFYGHENVTEEELSRFLPCDHPNFHDVLELVQRHMDPFYVENGIEPFASQAKERIDSLSDIQKERLYRLHEADKKACL